MTIRKGQEWGHFESRPADLQVVADDFSASELISSQTLDVKSPLQLSIIKSGLTRTLGVKNAPHHNQQMLCTKFDVIEANFVTVNSDKVIRRCFVGHAFVRSNPFFGQTIAILNTSFIGNRDWAPRAHPNDGKLDIVELDSSMNIRQRLTAFRLMKSGSHLPHPKIRYTQVNEYVIDCQFSASISIEGVRLGAIKKCDFKVLPDAVNLYW
jgi:hypothetical protein